MSSRRVRPRLPAWIQDLAGRCTRVGDPCPRCHLRRGPAGDSEAGRRCAATAIDDTSARRRIPAPGGASRLPVVRLRNREPGDWS